MMVDAGTLYSIAEAAELTGKSEKALRARMDRGKLAATWVRDGTWGRRHRKVTHYALAAAGILGTPRATRTDRSIDRLLTYLRARPDTALTTDVLAAQSGLSRQACESALATLHALGYVRKTQEPPPRGRVCLGFG